MNSESKKFSLNIVYSIVNSLITLLFPIITYPYVSRILLPEGIGEYNLAYGVLEYFILFAQLGIPLFGTRLIARVKNDSKLLQEKCSDIFTLNLITTLVAYVAFLLFTGINPTMKDNFLLFFVISFQLLSFCFSVEWYYQGIEDFRFITFKNLAVKTICAVLIFLLVNNQNDVIIYAMIMMFSTLAYSFVNFGKFLYDTRIHLSIKNIKSMIKSIFIVFLIYAASKLNSNIDVVMLGFMTGESGNYNVGIYTNATKIINMVISLATSINLVVLPRVVSLMNQKEEIIGLMKKMFFLIFSLSLIMMAGLYLVSSEIVLIFSGNEFSESIPTMKIMCGNVVLGTLTNYFGVQILYSRNKEIYTAISIIVGVIINIIVNTILIPRYLYFGAAIATIVSNSVILLLEIIFSIKALKVNFFSLEFIKTIILVAVMVLAIVIFSAYVPIDNIYLSLCVKMGIGILSCGVMLLLLWFNKIGSLIKKVKNDA